ncbi:MAG: hypothetical protein DSM107014_12930 [Gomphosphaeria aponina SAG 52.96 = DSM 107014]|uniref:Uncharacterized protein n=1 Tax=Gomphosphaeria aponina SAG 52.96 = DSM 107014 TaxID=1521640 RepID=A0A941GS10_9CHRO|nr:hypothetical protein [Gomphosphaeria aponina SAG 52.96 = DSM 107014]
MTSKLTVDDEKEIILGVDVLISLLNLAIFCLEKETKIDSIEWMKIIRNLFHRQIELLGDKDLAVFQNQEVLLSIIHNVTQNNN